ncbi:O-antigen polymerase [Halococcus salifodinae DSM 8989]|uniref:O-antigen polymerase n=2 Tax=Halococcus salifodinae TaxID=36738 RepID=M0N5W7_9EURY|nr:O-antigen polymerase [Halococcus salifodinae DSM 8989]
MRTEIALSAMDKPLAAFYLLLGSCIFGLSIFVSRFVGNLIILVSYVVFVVSAVVTTAPVHDTRNRRLPDIPFRYEPVILLSATVLWGVFFLGLILNPSPSSVLRTGAFIVLSAITLFVIPAVVTREQAFTAIGIVGAVCVLFSLPSALLGEFSVLSWTIDRVSATYVFILDTHVRSPTFIFDQQNYFRVLVAMGTVAAAGVATQTRSSRMAIVAALNLIGVYLTLGRAARLAVVVAAVLVFAYYLAGRTALAGVTIAGTGATVIAFAIAFGVLPGPTEPLRAVLGDRPGYWVASFRTFAARPFFGWGLLDTGTAIGNRYSGPFTGVHNSYLRLFVIGGIVGGVTYLVLCGSALVAALRRIRERTPLALTTFCLVVMALFFQLFDGATIFGTNLSSVLWALIIGYAQSPLLDTEPLRSIGRYYKAHEPPSLDCET